MKQIFVDMLMTEATIEEKTQARLLRKNKNKNKCPLHGDGKQCL